MFNEILGFTKEDVNNIIDYYTKVGVFRQDKEKTLKIMNRWFNNYRFSQRAKSTNMQMDYGKLRHLITVDGQLNGNFTKFSEILEKGGISSDIKTSFPYEKLADRENFISLLYFFGLLTFTGKNKKGLPFLTIPNETMKKQTYEYIRSSFEDVGAFRVNVFELKNLFQDMAYNGEFKPVFNFIAKEIKKQTKIRDYIHGEKVVQSFFIAYFNVIDFYISLSEEELNKGYADIVMKPFFEKYNDIKYAYLLELKYIPRMDDEKKLQNAIDKKVKKSKEQLDKYKNDEFSKKMMNLKPYGEVVLKKGIVVFHGWELIYIEEMI
ncbi:MAG: hypothetical protein B6I31_02335 [Desulfobacteraceae bacterium 4572_19]|nr:MAG: hypothetical protein B6I31_02335 [Desulfobacteraceae bacterium 4572_19]